MLVLHGHFRSSASHRVRIALNLKGLSYEQRFHHLRRGEQRSSQYLAINPQGQVPALEHDGTIITQSLAILEYLEEVFPGPKLLPADPAGRARARSIADICAVDTQPLTKAKVLQYLETNLGADQVVAERWRMYWLAACFEPIETRLAGEGQTGEFCHGDRPSFADICLVPQVLSAKRFGFDVSYLPTLHRVYQNAVSLEAFQKAMPDQQPDAE